MKSLLLAIFFFGLLWWGAHDVTPFKAIRRVIRRTPKAKPAPTGKTGRLQMPPVYEPTARRHPY